MVRADCCGPIDDDEKNFTRHQIGGKTKDFNQWVEWFAPMLRTPRCVDGSEAAASLHCDTRQKIPSTGLVEWFASVHHLQDLLFRQIHIIQVLDLKKGKGHAHTHCTCDARGGDE